MPFPYDKYPWLNFQELNLAYFIKHFREIFQQWDQLYHDLLDWKDATDADLAEWKTTVESGISSWETGLTAALEVWKSETESGLATWKTQTESDIGTWETATLAALEAWKTATTAVFEQIRTEAAASATAAAGSASDAETAKTAAQTAQAAAEAAAAQISASLAQITTNTDNILFLSRKIDTVDDAIGLIPITMTQGYVFNLNQTTIDPETPIENSSFSCAVIDCKEGDQFVISAEVYGNYRAYAFINSSNARLSVTVSGDNPINRVVIAPAYSAKLIINDRGNYVSYSGTKIDTLFDSVRALDYQKMDTHPGKNLFNPYSTGITENAYIGTNGALAPNSNYCVSDFIQVESGELYSFTDCYTSSVVNIAEYDENFNFVDTFNDTTRTIPANVKYIRSTILKTYRYTRAQIEKGSATQYEPYVDTVLSALEIFADAYDENSTYESGKLCHFNGFIYKAKYDIEIPEPFNAAHWEKIENFNENKSNIVLSNNAFRANGAALSADTVVYLPRTNDAKNVIYELCATFNSFSKITFGHDISHAKYASWVEIDDTYLIIYANMSGEPYRTTQFTHGLTIADFLNIQIITDDTYHCRVKIQTNGGDYSTPSDATFYGNSDGDYYFLSATTLTTYNSTVILRDACKPIYLFGDSYMSFATNRWVYYLKDLEQMDNILINAVGGANTARSLNSLNNLNGSPKFALWVIGMNDNSDNGTTPNSAWLAGALEFIHWCNKRNCIPVFGTIPTTPTITEGAGAREGKNNEGKNSWIRSSGYRYIDFAAAVGADAAGNWYPGMLTEGDWVHPTVQGAIALFHRAIADFPEIMSAL